MYTTPPPSPFSLSLSLEVYTLYGEVEQRLGTVKLIKHTALNSVSMEREEIAVMSGETVSTNYRIYDIYFNSI